MRRAGSRGASGRPGAAPAGPDEHSIGGSDRAQGAWRRVRQTFDRRFAAERMVTDYLTIYRQLGGARAQIAPARVGMGEASLPAMA